MMTTSLTILHDSGISLAPHAARTVLSALEPPVVSSTVHNDILVSTSLDATHAHLGFEEWRCIGDPRGGVGTLHLPASQQQPYRGQARSPAKPGECQASLGIESESITSVLLWPDSEGSGQDFRSQFLD